MATYTDCTSLQLAFRYVGTPGGVWAGEQWQTGLRLIVAPGPAHSPSAGRVDPTPFAVQDSTVQRTEGIWSISQGFSGVTQGGSVITDADINAILERVRVWADITRQYLANSFVFDAVRIYPMLPGGGSPFKAGKSATAPIIADPTTTDLNPAAPNLMPPDVAMALSLQTGTRGPSGRGRMFMGSLDRSWCTTTGIVAAGPQLAVGNATLAFINGLRNINSGSPLPEMRFTPVVYTKVPMKNGGGADTGNVVNLVRISDEFDTQRRRDHQRVDVYTPYGPVV